jgi:anthranilate synthase component I
MISLEQFNALAQQGFNRIPVQDQALADLETPLSLYLKLAHTQDNGHNSFLLESVVGGERFGRYSFIGLPCTKRLEARGFGKDAHVTVLHNGQVVQTLTGNPLDLIEAYQKQFRVALVDGLPRFCGGLAGYFGYDAVRHIEKKLVNTCPKDELDCPDILLLQCEEVAVIDNLSGKIHFIVYADPTEPNGYQRAVDRLSTLKTRLRAPVQVPDSSPTPVHQPVRGFHKTDYLAAVQRAKDLIAAGDFMQVQVGQRIAQPFEAEPISLYRVLRSLNPSPYMYYYNFGDFQVVGASPEILVRQEKMPDQQIKVTIRPLAGTRPRGATPEIDKATEHELVSDPKEIAEHVMLIDLARNDIGRIAQTGTVKVTESFAVERYSHVMHIVSNVEGVLKPGLSSMDVLKASFPAGTLTGAPKVHAMELIDELEPVKRGIYGGACGYISYAGDMDLAIAIRTGVIKNNMLYVQAAAGVVADSVPELEWAETEHKSRALLRAAEIVEGGLQ